MCGICGEITFRGGVPSSSLVQTMCDQMEKRGPDCQGLWAQRHLALGQRRLKIIDLSDRSQQPMHDPHLGLTIVFNGAIYNYPELKKELEGKGYSFFSSGDTEVILKAFHAWGAECVQRFNGMFAFAVFERDSGRVTLARDRLGIKPLYYSQTRNAFTFASSLPALLHTKDVDTRIDPVALNHYMTFHSVVPAPRTILMGVRKLPPATILTVEPDGRTSQQTYWKLSFDDDDRAMTEADWQEAVLESLRTAVKRRLIADVPVGVLLSGGLDSSLVVGLLAEAGQQGLNTFSVGFEAVGGEKGDEFQYSDIIAERFSTRHHKIEVDRNRTLNELPRCIGAMSEPMVSHDNIGFFLLSEEVSKQVKVVQSGQGADEIFAGYHWYPPMMTSDNPVEDYAEVFFDRDHQEYLEAVHPDLHTDDAAKEFVARHFNRPGAQRPVDKALRLDSTVMLVDDPVKRVDNMTMAWGLEARVPFLDHELVELSARVPAELKVKGGGKHVLKEAARKIIPSQVIDRPKGYFPVPALKYLQGPYLDMVREVVSGPTARDRHLFNRSYVDTLLDAPSEHITPLKGSKLWQVALLEMWLQTNGI